jgi:hypothetical protein
VSLAAKGKCNAEMRAIAFVERSGCRAAGVDKEKISFVARDAYHFAYSIHFFVSITGKRND